MDKTKAIEKPTLPCPCEMLIPHRPPMLLIDQLIRRSDTEAEAITSLQEKSPFIDPNKGILPEIFIEIIAQTTAAANGFDGLINNKKPNAGFLVGLDEFSLTSRPFSECQLRAEIKKMFKFGDITIFQGKLFSGEFLLAAGKIQIWEDHKEA